MEPGMEYQRLNGKCAIVTGGATLIGQAVVRRLVSEGATVLVCDVDDVNGLALCDEIGTGARFLHTDVTNDADLSAAVRVANDDLGGIDILVYLACVYNDDGPQSSRDQWRDTLNVNLVRAAMLAKFAHPYMSTRNGAAIVNFTSTSSSVAQVGRWTYPASKAALVQLTRSMAMDFANDGIRVNSVSPGWTWSSIMDKLSQGNRVKTNHVAAPFHLTNRVGDPDEIAAVVAFLCSDEASVVTGADWAADGGYSAMGPEQAVAAISKLMD